MDEFSDLDDDENNLDHLFSACEPSKPDCVSDVRCTKPEEGPVSGVVSLPGPIGGGELSEGWRIPADFPFPFEPYDIQRELMREVYVTLCEGKIGLFESPTGTGKSLSLICSTMKWLEDHRADQERQLDRLQNSVAVGVSSIPPHNEKPRVGARSWIAAYEEKLHAKKKLQGVQEEIKLLQKIDNQVSENAKSTKKRFESAHRASSDSAHTLGDSDSEDEHMIVQDSVDTADESGHPNTEEEVHITKVYYCSRTHSQLAQFVHEVQKSPYSATVKLVTLGSRQNLCVNPSVQKLKSVSLMNEKCLEMARAKSTKTKGGKKMKTSSGCCVFRDASKIDQLKVEILSKVVDIEDTVKSSRRTKACPYYASRRAVGPAQIVALPYNVLLHQGTREKMGIRLKGHVVVVDEAHNLLDTISAIHSVTLTRSQVSLVNTQLQEYQRQYATRFRADNLRLIKQLQILCSQLLSLLSNDTKEEPRSFSVDAFITHSKLDQINLFEMSQFLQKTRLAQKLSGFVMRLSVKLNDVNTAESPSSESGSLMSSPLYAVQEFLATLMNKAESGKIFISKDDKGSMTVKYLLLNPAQPFEDIIKDARAVVIAGGTMQPISEFTSRLFHNGLIGPERIRIFSCGHVAKPENILPLVMSNSAEGRIFDFTYRSRGQPTTLQSLCKLIVDVGSLVPGGTVCFLPSYEYADRMFEFMNHSGFYQKLEGKVKIFREPKSSKDVSSVLQQYSRAIMGDHPKSTTSEERCGAILFSVVGGKMSEGINFSDDMGRCIIMVGMPYPNIHSPELKEKMSYLDRHLAHSHNALTPGREYYEGLCMKAVNQSIGRAIRHKDDYASILFVDSRYKKGSVLSRLPGWIGGLVKTPQNYDSSLEMMRVFFKSMKSPK